MPTGIRLAVVRRPQVLPGRVDAVGQQVRGRLLGGGERGGQVGERSRVEHVLGVRRDELLAVARELGGGHRPQHHAVRRRHGSGEVEQHLGGHAGVRRARAGQPRARASPGSTSTTSQSAPWPRTASRSASIASDAASSRYVEAAEQRAAPAHARHGCAERAAVATYLPGRLLPVARKREDLDHAGATVTGTPLSAALPERSSRSGSVRSLMETPGTLVARRSRTPSTWWP